MHELPTLKSPGDITDSEAKNPAKTLQLQQAKTAVVVIQIQYLHLDDRWGQAPLLVEQFDGGGDACGLVLERKSLVGLWQQAIPAAVATVHVGAQSKAEAVSSAILTELRSTLQLRVRKVKGYP